MMMVFPKLSKAKKIQAALLKGQPVQKGIYNESTYN